MTVKLKTPSNGSVSLTPQDTAADVVLTVPSGTGSQLAVADSSGYTYSGGLVVSPQTGFKNRIINGGMDIWQRGTSFSSPSNITYLADRWFVGIGGSNIASAARVSGPSGFRYAIQLTGGAGNSTTQFNQRIEAANTYDLVGQSVTLQANIQVSVAQTVRWSLYYPSAVDNFNSLTLISSGTWSGTTAATTFTATVNNLPANVSNGLMVLISPNNGGAFTSGTITITGVQLEKGTVATPFEFRSYGQELALCQRYYQNAPSTSITLYAPSTVDGNSFGWIPLLVQMRATPTYQIGSGGSGGVTVSASYVNGATVYKAGGGSTYQFISSWNASAEL